jgi:peroxiredoxin
VPERLVEIKERHKLSFFVASDKDNLLGQKFGIVFTAAEPTQKALAAKGNHLGEITGTGTWDLPMPSVIVIGQDRVVRFAEVSPDWLVRTEAPEILTVVRAISAGKAIAA